ncbi:MAG: hypothetical protein R3B45_15685 [Bdellovibrionota bacterium]
MDNKSNLKNEIFSYHLVELSFFSALKLLFFPPTKRKVPGLKFSLCLFAMNLGQNIFSFSRYRFNTLAFIARWSDEESLERFLSKKANSFGSASAWHIRMRPYRRWGSFTGLEAAYLFEEFKNPRGSVVGLTVAKLRLSQVRRFTKWGKPVECQVKSNKGKKLAVVSMKPLRFFSTFSIWRTEDSMLSMVNGNKEQMDGMNHKEAMQERSRKPCR